MNLEIGGGKLNTAIAMASRYAFVGKYTNNTVWAFLKRVNDAKLMGHDDWFIPNYAEAYPFFDNPYFSGFAHWLAWLSEEHDVHGPCENHAYMFKRHDWHRHEWHSKEYEVKYFSHDPISHSYSDVCLFRAF